MATYTVRITAKGADKVLSKLSSYRKHMDDKCDELAKRLAEIGVRVANEIYESAPYAGTNDVKVDMTPEGKGTIRVFTKGDAALFIEFGTGVLNPENWRARGELKDSVALHGQYGYKRANSPFGWDYEGSMPSNPPTGTSPSTRKRGYVHTYGEAPHPAMYIARKEMIENIEKIAREVFEL